MNPLVCIIGTTATGKTRLAVALASQINGEILSADSRQVYRGMDLGTGKDLEDFTFQDKTIPYHLIDIANAGEEYNVFRYKKDFSTAYNSIIKNGRTPILCGGSGMYVDAIINDYKLDSVPQNLPLREKLDSLSLDELSKYLKSIRKLHNTTDISNKERCIRAIEIEEFYRKDDNSAHINQLYNSIIFGIKFDRAIIRSRITNRLSNRLDNGMVEEVTNLLNQGVNPEMFKFYGLEYKYLTQFILGEISRKEMFEKLNIAIHQFAKRQETWWRRMEKRGTKILWIDGSLPLDKKLSFMISELKLRNFIK